MSEPDGFTETEMRSAGRLLESVENIDPVVPSSPTMLQILGVDDRELRVSRMLQFFLDPVEAHGMDDLMLRALLRTIGVEPVADDTILEVEHVEREETVPAGGRIDLVVYADTFVVCVELKLFATVSNDLTSYHDHVARLAEDREFYCVLLGLRAQTELALGELRRVSDADFEVATYDTLFRQIEVSLGSHIAKANRRYVDMLLDLMQSIRELGESRMEFDPDFLSFVTNEAEDLHQLLERIDKLKKEMRERVGDVRDRVSEQLDAEGPDLSTVLYRRHPFEFFDSVAIKDLEPVSGMVIELHCRLRTDGWEFRIKPKGRRDAEEMWSHISELLDGAVVLSDDRSRLLLREKDFSFDAQPGEVSDYTLDVIEKLEFS